ncbi:hypothetical protein F4861DRAFT_509791 [Xylaria intraflava]|nr:hypothetical protein F4861DRAFT_509791 [Xylaria intraflava]
MQHLLEQWTLDRCTIIGMDWTWTAKGLARQGSLRFVAKALWHRIECATGTAAPTTSDHQTTGSILVSWYLGIPVCILVFWYPGLATRGHPLQRCDLVETERNVEDRRYDHRMEKACTDPEPNTASATIIGSCTKGRRAARSYISTVCAAHRT